MLNVKENIGIILSLLCKSERNTLIQ